MKKQMKRKEGLLNRIVKGIINLSKRELFKNKMFSMLFMILGYISVPLLDGNITVCVFMMLIGIALFFEKKNVID